MMRIPLLLAFLWSMMCLTAQAFTTATNWSPSLTSTTTLMKPLQASNQAEDDQDEVVARRIIVQGAVQGGYYRACVLNEAGRFRRLVGTMTPPDETDMAEIYVEGKRNLVEGFIRWCQRGKVGLNQQVTVKDVVEEDPTGLYDAFYVRTH